MSSDVVRSQYEHWAYPLPVDDMEEAIRTGSYWEIGDPALYWPVFWPARRTHGPLDILIAGCGTNQAAYYACRHPDSRVIGVDLSDSSISHGRRLKEKHGLDNLTLITMDMNDIAALGLEFDFIAATGVLHHLPDPVRGLAALASVLRPEGVVNVMVYGTSLRLGVYLMQDLFRTLGLGQSDEDVGVVTSVISTLPADHVLRRYLRTAPDLDYSAGVVDTFLHGRDRSYYVPEVYDLAHEAGLEFLSWCDPVEYSLDSHVSPEHPAWSRLRELNERDAAHACDLLTQSRGTHRFALAHPDYVRATRIPFDDDRFLDCTVVWHPDARRIHDGDPAGRTGVRYERRGYTFEIDSRLDDLLAAASTGRSLADAVITLELSAEERDALLDRARGDIASLRSRGHVHVLLPD
jgi:SAM-dependent methyltransferase